MTCETYKAELIESAAAREEVRPALRSHLDVCLSCRDFYAREQSLFAAVDAELSRAVNEEPTPSFLPRVRAAMDGRAPLHRPTRVRFAFWPGVAAVIGVCVLASVMIPRGRSPRNESAREIASANSAMRPAVTPSAATKTDLSANAVVGPVGIRERTKEASRRAASSAIVPAVPQGAPFGNADVIVPSAEREALAQFVAEIGEGRQIAIALVRPEPATVSANPAPDRLEIAELSIEPLARSESE